MQRIITKLYHFTILILSLTLITNTNLVSIYSYEDPTNALFASIGKDIDKSIIPTTETPTTETPTNALFASIGKDIDKSIILTTETPTTETTETTEITETPTTETTETTEITETPTTETTETTEITETP